MKNKNRWTHFTRDFFPPVTSVCGKEYSGCRGMSFTNKKENVTCHRCLSALKMELIKEGKMKGVVNPNK